MKNGQRWGGMCCFTPGGQESLAEEVASDMLVLTYHFVEEEMEAKKCEVSCLLEPGEQGTRETGRRFAQTLHPC